MTWHHPALAKGALAESDVEIKTLRAENERLRAYQNETAKAWTKLTESQEQEIDRLRAAVADERNKVATAATELLAICDGSNWPAEAQSGVGYRLYTDLTDRLHDIAGDLRSAITAGKDV